MTAQLTIPCLYGLHRWCRGACLQLVVIESNRGGWAGCTCPCHREEVAPHE